REAGMSRMLPTLTPATEFFWRAGASGRLLVLRCDDCATYLHPPAPVCPRCLSRRLAPHPVSGRGRVYSCTVNFQPWRPELETPYVIAIVELEEQAGLRLLTNVVGCPVEEVRIGMEVEVTFAAHGDVYLPLFRPVAR
ncbi:MAG: Zn-ribbon domain-containing OB-fold protein, partial [Candidatus Binatia bacterium]